MFSPSDCGEKPLPRHAEVIYYVDSKNGSQVQIQCKNYTTTPNRTGVAECSSGGEWTWTQSIQCTGLVPYLLHLSGYCFYSHSYLLFIVIKQGFN